MTDIYQYEVTEPGIDPFELVIRWLKDSETLLTPYHMEGYLRFDENVISFTNLEDRNHFAGWNAF